MKILAVLRNLVILALCALILASSNLPPADTIERVRDFTRNIEFDYITWTANALFIKTVQSAVGASRYMTDAEQHQVVTTDLMITQEIDDTNANIIRTYANPQVTNPNQAAAEDSNNLDKLRDVESQVQPVSEAVLQQQVSSVLAEQGLTLGGQAVPPVMFHSTPLPLALIISPRDNIRQEANISLVADLTIPQQVQLEEDVSKKLNVSALVVPVGGVGIYPTMVMSTTDLPWLAETIAHEWTHNYLTMRPLGLNYETTPALRTMNETTASIVGTEIGEMVMKKFYPEFLPPPQPEAPQAQQPQGNAPTAQPTQPPQPPPFSFRKAMHTTRVNVDEMLAQGKIKEAEDYMEAQRLIFWEHGYQIRKLNQAYFAFYGAYADDAGGGAFGSDPVGPAVQALRARSKSLADFVNRIAWMSSFKQLEQAVK